MEYLQLLLKEIGLEPERAHMFNLSAAMAGQFVEVTKEMTEKIAELGPNPLKKNESGTGGAE